MLRLIGPFALVLTSALLSMVGFWQLIPAVEQVSVDHIATKLLANQDVAPGQLLQLEKKRADGIAWWPASAWLTELAAAHLRGSSMDPPLQPGDLNRALSIIDRAIALNPTNSFAWAVLSYAWLRSKGASPKVVEGWRNSTLTGPAEQFILWRFELGLAVRTYMKEDDTALLKQQLRLAWLVDRRRVIDLVQRYGAALLLENALSQSTGDLLDLKVLVFYSRPGFGEGASRVRRAEP